MQHQSVKVKATKLKGSIPSGGLEGMAVLVTGGGTGIGAACASRLAEDGAAVTICGRTEAKLEDAAKRIEAAAAATGKGGSIQLTAGDVTNEEDVARIMAKAAEPTGELDGVVANAGGGGGMGPYHLQDTDEFLRVLRPGGLAVFSMRAHYYEGEEGAAHAARMAALEVDGSWRRLAAARVPYLEKDGVDAFVFVFEKAGMRAEL